MYISSKFACASCAAAAQLIHFVQVAPQRRKSCRCGATCANRFRLTYMLETKPDIQSMLVLTIQFLIDCSQAPTFYL